MWGSGPYHTSVCGIGETIPKMGIVGYHSAMFCAHVLSSLCQFSPGLEAVPCSVRSASFTQLPWVVASKTCAAHQFKYPLAIRHLSVAQPYSCWPIASVSNPLSHQCPCSYGNQPSAIIDIGIGRIVHIPG